MWLMKTLLTSRCINQRGAGQRVAVTQMEQVTQQNASLVEEIAATTSSVEEQSEALNQAVAVFHIAPQTRS
ncbi:hypothetical protein EW653_08590 [Salmonella enterica subsp. enterica serovar Rauform]|nr:hypothetical protein EW655_01225 [Salmonella enterica subsp. enterica serovar Rauform]THC03896.1 hypothetical protein EW653_08590 [Salmonella enterica subsp. enterica serovar Rauform]